MLSLINRKEEIKNSVFKLRKLKKEYKELQKSKKPYYSSYLKTIEEKNKARYFNIAHTLIKKSKREDLLSISNIELLNLILSFKIETKWKEEKLEEYGYLCLQNKDKNIKTSIKSNCLRNELERIYNGN